MFNNWRNVFQRACLPQRYIFAIMGFLAIGNGFAMRNCLSIAILDMVHHSTPDNEEDDVCTCHVETLSPQNSTSTGKFYWDESTQGLIIGSFFWGYLVTHIPGGLFAEKFGGKYTLGFGILLSSIFTLLMPLAADFGGAGLVIAARVIQGLGQGPLYPALNFLLAQWAPVQERSRMSTLVYAGAQIGTVVCYIISGALLHHTSLGWMSIFYFFGSLGILWFVLWILLAYDDPSCHPFISKKEEIYLEKYIGSTIKSKSKPPVPWKSLFSSLPIWGLIIYQIGFDWSFTTLVTYLPKYMYSVMKFNMEQNGYLSALPNIATFIFSLVSSWVADFLINKEILSIKNTRKLFSTIASLGSSAAILAVSSMECNRGAVVALITTSSALLGASYSGAKANPLDLSPHYAGTLMALINGAGALSGIISPYIIGMLTPDKTLAQWEVVFWITGVVFIVANIVYLFTASGDVQPWDNITPLEDDDERQYSYHESTYF